MSMYLLIILWPHEGSTLQLHKYNFQVKLVKCSLLQSFVYLNISSTCALGHWLPLHSPRVCVSSFWYLNEWDWDLQSQSDTAALSHTWHIFLPTACLLFIVIWWDRKQSPLLQAFWTEHGSGVSVTESAPQSPQRHWLHSSGTVAYFVFWRGGVTCSGLHAG